MCLTICSTIRFITSDDNWVDIFGTNDANTCVSLFYEKLERSFELFAPVFVLLLAHDASMVHKRIAEFKYSSRMANRELYERQRAEHRYLYNEGYASYMNDIENGIKRDPSDFLILLTTRGRLTGYLSSMRYDGSLGECAADICDLFESVYI
jgi:hypothetical protein